MTHKLTTFILNACKQKKDSKKDKTKEKGKEKGKKKKEKEKEYQDGKDGEIEENIGTAVAKTVVMEDDDDDEIHAVGECYG